jgi:hypothetical protein
VEKKLIVINLFAGPGGGKSTTAYGAASLLKQYGLRAELVTEVAKDATWEEHRFLLSQQVSLFSEQLRRQTRLIGKRDVVITDSPILLPALVYNNGWANLPALAWEAWDKFENLNFFVRRMKKYDPEGRRESEEEARAKDVASVDVLDRFKVPYTVVDGNPYGIIEVVEHYLKAFDVSVDREAITYN